MTVADRATTLGLISSAVISFSVSSSAVGWRRRVGGGIVIAESSSAVRPPVRLSVAVLLRIFPSAPLDRLLARTCRTYVAAPTSGLRRRRAATLMNY